ncbi:Disease resistance protein (CC-NBS-LRR class) family [Rhynchospora pubera]|uniref:Disease resistance protein (CC-NBS-LRR class) family n=1 Tax=Rhynchospora pubera TaxID=906938 RepID=A0AAV8DD99_9POAL|nr:Disease resistance protein (CC-NBS-LRR class) family [Rhynchospora pubera]
MGLYGVISNLLSLGAQLLPSLSASAQAPSSSSSSSPQVESQQIETELKRLMRMLERIKATLYDAEMREIRDLSVKLWLKELKGVAYDAEDVLDEYRYEVSRAEVEARVSSTPPNSRKRKLIQVPDGMLNQIRQIRSKFSEIEKDRLALRLMEEDGPRRCNSDHQIPPTSHFVVESDIIGREREKESLIDVLSSASQDGEIISVVTIVGTGGIGKTTLAKLVYNDQRIKQIFDKFGWVCVSENFNVQRLTIEVIESITGKSCDLANFSALQEHMKKKITNKKVFLVLDDVWNESSSFWELFKAPFMSALLMKILVTTRNEHVAQIMQTVPTFSLGYMSEEQSWQLFKHYAFSEVTQNVDLNFIEIGKQIMKKCGMLPLAIKSIASLLRHELKEESWRDILGSELWESDASNEIFQPLQISYARLPTYLKPCFLYCSMFPRGYRSSAEELVKLWISQGYVQTNGLESVEKIGMKYTMQLWERSFFQGALVQNECNEKEFYFTLHDMVHDLARFNSGDTCYYIEGDMFPNFPQELHHLFVHRWIKIEEPPPPGKFATLRSFITEDNWVTFLKAFDFSEAQNLRTIRLDPRDVHLESHFSFSNLKHLRYLSIKNGYFRRLPECICSLYNLQILTLNECPQLLELPESIGNLVSLEELTIMACRDLKVLPVSFCQLSALRKLSIQWCYVLEELPPDIENLVSLEELKLIFCGLRVLPMSLCQLKALRKVELWENKLEELPTDMGKLVSLEKLTIHRCDNLRILPVSLCKLNALRELHISRCSKLGVLPHDMVNLNLQLWNIRNKDVCPLPLGFNKILRIPRILVKLDCMIIGWLENFVDLEGTLVLRGLKDVCSLYDVHCANIASMHNLQLLILCWNSRGNYNYRDKKKVLHLSIRSNSAASSEIDHNSLLGRLQPHPNLKEIQIESYQGLTFPDWFGNPTLDASLERIVLSSCESITFLPFGGFEKLKHLHISGCTSLQFIHEQFLPLALEEIMIKDCKSLLSVKGIEKLKSLIKLDIRDCNILYWLDPCGNTDIITVVRCPKVRDLCLQRDIYYKK